MYIKYRYSDFIVNEIDPEGKLAILPRVQGELEVKEENKNIEDGKEEDKEWTGEQGPKKIEISKEAEDAIHELLGEEGNGLIGYIKSINDGVLERTAQYTLNHMHDKDKRTKVHQIFKDHLKDFETHTKEEGWERKIIVFLEKEISKNKRKKLDMRLRKDENPHIKLVMMKENIESMQAVHNISKLVKKMPKYFGVAGNKDKRGI